LELLGTPTHIFVQPLVDHPPLNRGRVNFWCRRRGGQTFDTRRVGILLQGGKILHGARKFLCWKENKSIERK
ncbi:unnamed protein product, partial [Allacma fusca]